MMIVLKPTYTVEVTVQDEAGTQTRADKIADQIRDTLATAGYNMRQINVRLVRFEHSHPIA